MGTFGFVKLKWIFHFRPLPLMDVVELFAGVGGFRCGLDDPSYRFVWSNQWEPGARRQWASECYVKRFSSQAHSNSDITAVEATSIPRHDLLVGGFPCQDYSVMTSNAQGIEGKKGVLWWHIHRIAKSRRPAYLLLENVDRLLKSPTKQRGRDFGVVLRCLANLDYVVEWRVINAADYGFPQKRRRVFLLAAQRDSEWGQHIATHANRAMYASVQGFFARRFRVRQNAVLDDYERDDGVSLPKTLIATSDRFTRLFENSGVMVNGKIWSTKVAPAASRIQGTLGSVLQKDVPEKYFVPPGDLPQWEFFKGPKAERRTAKTGFVYHYTEGGMPFPDRLDSPARTILTSEGGLTPSRSRHIIMDPDAKRHRVLTPMETERLNGFDDDWTALDGIPDRWRYFCMGNALVVGLVSEMSKTLLSNPSKAALPWTETTVRQWASGL